MKAAIVRQAGRAPVYGDLKEPAPVAVEVRLAVTAAAPAMLAAATRAVSNLLMITTSSGSTRTKPAQRPRFAGR